MILVTQDDFDTGAVVQDVRARTAGQAGALVTFTGYVRDYASDAGTRSLFLDYYPGMCENELQAIADQAAARWNVQDAAIVHRAGELALGEQIVLVVVASAHRGDAFAACEFIMDALKTRAPFWKRETLADGSSFWVQARESDLARTRRWDEGAQQ
ncbi:MAG: molybdenum cofactor biosynthesis protein MoaE [Comamonadaceae bacterium]|nr:MAG: molybdenum cofactor biosynthesis protein MoaE [Comamonadaceae bacterium]